MNVIAYSQLNIFALIFCLSFTGMYIIAGKSAYMTEAVFDYIDIERRAVGFGNGAMAFMAA
jgi:hypothetical protein